VRSTPPPHPPPTRRPVCAGAHGLRLASESVSVSLRAIRLRIERRSAEGDEDRDSGLGADFAGHVTLAGEIFGDQDVARAQTPDRAVADLDVERAAEGGHGRAPGPVTPWM